MSELYHKVIRLAHSNPELRPHILPLLKESSLRTGSAKQQAKDVFDDYFDELASLIRSELGVTVKTLKSKSDALMGGYQKKVGKLEFSLMVILRTSQDLERLIQNELDADPNFEVFEDTYEKLFTYEIQFKVGKAVVSSVSGKGHPSFGEGRKVVKQMAKDIEQLKAALPGR